MDLQSFFDSLVDVTEPICQKIDESFASMTIFDTSGIEAFVTENNPNMQKLHYQSAKSFQESNRTR